MVKEMTSLIFDFFWLDNSWIKLSVSLVVETSVMY